MKAKVTGKVVEGQVLPPVHSSLTAHASVISRGTGCVSSGHTCGPHVSQGLKVGMPNNGGLLMSGDMTSACGVPAESAKTNKRGQSQI